MIVSQEDSIGLGEIRNIVAAVEGDMRDKYGPEFTLKITDGHRREDAGYGANNSQHHNGRAMDISMRGLSPEQREDLVAFCIERGATAVGCYPGNAGLHVDNRPGGGSGLGGLAQWYGMPGSGHNVADAPAWYQRGVAAGLASIGGRVKGTTGPGGERGRDDGVHGAAAVVAGAGAGGGGGQGPIDLKDALTGLVALMTLFGDEGDVPSALLPWVNMQQVVNLSEQFKNLGPFALDRLDPMARLNGDGRLTEAHARTVARGGTDESPRTAAVRSTLAPQQRLDS